MCHSRLSGFQRGEVFFALFVVRVERSEEGAVLRKYCPVRVNVQSFCGHSYLLREMAICVGV